MSNEVTRVMVVEHARSFQEVVMLILSLEPSVKIVFTADSGEEVLAACTTATPGLTPTPADTIIPPAHPPLEVNETKKGPQAEV